MDNSQQELLDKIKNLIPINGLQEKYQQQLLKQARLFKYPKGKVVFNQGDRDGYSYYLLSGQVELESDGSLVKKVVEDSEGARSALAQLQPRMMTAKATQVSILVRFDRELLNRLMALDAENDKAGEAIQVSEDTGEVDWMTAMLESELFTRIPAANIQRIFSLMEEVEYKPGDKIIQQGEAGDFYYIIQSGRCMVLRTTEEGKEVQLAELGPGESFGEEALVSESKRNASVVMLTAGEVMRLTKEDFAELIKKPVLNAISYEEALERIHQGECWLDIRFPDEHESRCIPGSLNIPLKELRKRAGELDPAKSYIVYSDVGSRASVAAYLLSQLGIDVSYLESGISSTPFAASASDNDEQPISHTIGPIPGLGRAEEVDSDIDEEDEDDDDQEVITEIDYNKQQVERDDEEDVQPSPAIQDDEEEDRNALDVGVRAASLKADLVKADLKMQEAEKLKQEVEDARARMEAELEEKMRKEREKMTAEAERVNMLLQEAQRMKQEIADAKQQAEKEVEERRQQEEERIQQLQIESEKRLREEEARLEEVYARNTEELLRVQKMKEEAAAELQKRTRLLEEESQASKQEMEEARRLKLEAEEQLQRQIEEQDALEKKLRLEAEERIRKERKKLEGEFARTTAELQQAQRARVAAEVARRAATQEAEQIINELRTTHTKSKQEGEAKLQAEKKKLEEEARHIRDELGLAQRARQEAEEARMRAEREVEKLAIMQEAAQKSHTGDKDKLKAEIAAVKAIAAQAQQQLDSAVVAEKAATNAQIINEQEMKRTVETSEELRGMLEADISSWMEEQERFENSTNQREENLRMLEQMKRIAKRAEEAHQRAKKNEQSLFDDLAAFRDSDD